MVNWYSFPTLGIDTCFFFFFFFFFLFLFCNGPAVISSRFKHVILVQVKPVSSLKLKITDQATVSFYVFHGDMSLIGVNLTSYT